MFQRTRKAVYFLGPFTVVCLLLGSIFLSYIKAFDSSKFLTDGAYNHIAELTSAKYSGRLAGSTGNKMAMQYVENYFKQIGLEPAGDNNTYYQGFRTMVPSYNSEPIFRIFDTQGNMIKEYKYGTEYLENLSGLGGWGLAKGKLFYANDAQLNGYQAGLIKDKIIVLKQVPEEMDILYALNNGVKAIIAPGTLKKYPGDLGLKSAQNLPVLTVDPVVYQNLISSKTALEAEIKVDIAASFVETANVLGKIPGKGPGYLFISADLDYLGKGESGNYFPGAFDGASGVGLMLELAKTLKEQKIKPDKTIIFAAWNNQQYGAKGAAYYVQHPLFPLKKSQVMTLQDLGGTNELTIKSFDNLSNLFGKVIGGYAEEQNIKLEEKNIGVGHFSSFLSENVPGVMISDTYANSQALSSSIYTYKDDLSMISKQSLGQTSTVIMNYLRREVFKDYFPDYLGKTGVAVLSVLGAGLLGIYIIFILHKGFPALTLGKLAIEDIYYSTIFQVFSKGYFYLITVLLLFLVVVFVANVPRDFNIVYSGGEIHNNFSLFLVIKRTLSYIGALPTSGFASTKNGTNFFSVIGGAFGKSFILLFLVILISSLLGTLKGLRDGFKERGKAALGGLGALGVLSVPDVLIVVFMQLAVTFLYQHHLLFFLDSHKELKTFIVALLCLVILPTVYVSRIAATAVTEELKKDYIITARAKGLPDLYLLRVHLLPGVAIRVLDALPAVLGQIISNLIIVEYLFYYPGIVFVLLKSFEQNDTSSFIGLAMSLGLIYVLFNLCFRLIARRVNPLRKGGLL